MGARMGRRKLVALLAASVVLCVAVFPGHGGPQWYWIVYDVGATGIVTSIGRLVCGEPRKPTRKESARNGVLACVILMAVSGLLAVVGLTSNPSSNALRSMAVAGSIGLGLTAIGFV